MTAIYSKLQHIISIFICIAFNIISVYNIKKYQRNNCRLHCGIVMDCEFLRPQAQLQGIVIIGAWRKLWHWRRQTKGSWAEGRGRLVVQLLEAPVAGTKIQIQQTLMNRSRQCTNKIQQVCAWRRIKKKVFKPCPMKIANGAPLPKRKTATSP